MPFLFCVFGNFISRLLKGGTEEVLTIPRLKPCLWVCLLCLSDSRAMALWFPFSVKSSTQVSASSHLQALFKRQVALAPSATSATVLHSKEPLSDHGLLCSMPLCMKVLSCNLFLILTRLSFLSLYASPQLLG